LLNKSEFILVYTQTPWILNVLFWKMIIISNHNKKFSFYIKFFLLQYKLQLFFIHHVHYTPFVCSEELKKFKDFEMIWKPLWTFKMLEFHIFKIMSVFLMWLLGCYHLFKKLKIKNIWILSIILCKNCVF
jgi:hypothetical protein